MTEQIHGIIAGSSLLLLCVFSIKPLRQRFYEVFNKAHTFFYLMIIINVGMHKPDLSRKVIWIVTFVAASYTLSRLVRAGVLLYNSYGNTATLIPLEGATKVIFKRRIGAKPGDHVLLKFPSLAWAESHPFTISDTEFTQLRIRKRDGFTATLHEKALESPGKSFPVLIEGPFGATPNFHMYDKVLLVAGGIGATFAISVALDLIRRDEGDRSQSVKMLWIVRSEGELQHAYVRLLPSDIKLIQTAHLDWFSDELKEIQRSLRVEVTIFITNPGAARCDASIEKDFASKSQQSVSDLSTIRRENGKPDIEITVNDLIRGSRDSERIIVSCCGPPPLMTEVRDIVATSIPLQGPSITLTTEQFGW
jgi:predicted ferric reductase